MKILRVTAVEGEASVTVSRGKKRYIYDYTVTLDWKLSMGSVLSISGSATASDVNAEGDFEVSQRV